MSKATLAKLVLLATPELPATILPGLTRRAPCARWATVSLPRELMLRPRARAPSALPEPPPPQLTAPPPAPSLPLACRAPPATVSPPRELMQQPRARAPHALPKLGPPQLTAPPLAPSLPLAYRAPRTTMSVSYTHLTLPTILRV